MDTRTRFRPASILATAALVLVGLIASPTDAEAQQTFRPPLHGQHWMALTGKPLAATAGAMMFQQGGNAIDAAVAMLGATSTMWDVLGWGGETQALIYNPETGEVIGVNGLGFAPTGATPAFFHEQGMHFPPEYGPHAAVTPGTPGALMVMLAEFGTLSLADVLAPSIQMADGYPIEAQTANNIERNRRRIAEWEHSRRTFLPHLDPEDAEKRAAPEAGEIFRQPDLARTLRRLVEAEADALTNGATREEAIMAAYDRFYRGDIAEELVRGTQAEGGLITMEDLDAWEVRLEAPVSTTYRDYEVFKLDFWTQGPAMLQALNLLENEDLKGMGYNSARYIHTLYQAVNMAFADRDFYYGDPLFEPRTPAEGLLSKEYARDRWAGVNRERNDPNVAPGDPYPYQGGANPFAELLAAWEPNPAFLNEDPPGSVVEDGDRGLGGPGGSVGNGARGNAGTSASSLARADFEPWDPDDPFYRGTTAIQTADAEGWVVSVTPSGGWIPAFIAGETGVGLSQRMQSFVLDARMNPYNVLQPRMRPRVTLTPTMALKDGLPALSFAVQGGDGQDQNLLQMFLNVVEFGMTVQEAAEAANMNSSQMRGSFGRHLSEPGRLLVQDETPSWVMNELRSMGYDVRTGARTSGPLMGIWFDRVHGTFWGGVSHHGEDYGISW